MNETNGLYSYKWKSQKHIDEKDVKLAPYIIKRTPKGNYDKLRENKKGNFGSHKLDIFV